LRISYGCGGSTGVQQSVEKLVAKMATIEAITKLIEIQLEMFFV
jgi:hypothetical protein